MLAVAVLGVFMAFIDATIVNIAVPSIHREFPGEGLSNVSWVLNAYNIVFAAFLVGGGQLADLLGRRRVFSVSLLAFTFASLLCAVAPTLDMLIAARVIQAAGAAALVPSSLAIVLEAHDASERMHAVALWAAVGALAAGIGPPLGGVLITASSWRLVFLVNIPIGIAAFLLSRRVLVESRAPGRRRVPDLLGGVVLALAIASLVLAVVKGEEWGWGSARVVSAFLLAILLGVYFVLRSSHQRTPVIDLSLLRIRSFALSNGVTVVGAGGFYAYTLCNVLFLTTVWSYSVLQAGLALTPGPFVAIAVAGPASRMVARFGYRAIVVPGALVWAAGMAFFATQLGVAPDFLGEWLPGMVILGIGAGLTFPTLSAAAVGSVPGPRFAVATSLNSVARQVGAALGVAVLIAILGHPGPLEVLHSFEHGWAFAGGCFLFASLACLGLVVKQPENAVQNEKLGAAVHLRDEGIVEPQTHAAELPSLAESAGEHALVEPQTAADFLRNVPVFAGLASAMLEQIARLAGDVSLSRGEWLFREGDPADGVYVVRVGHLEVVRDGPEPETVHTLTRGAVLGELALLSDSVRSASIRALRDTELLKIDKEHFNSLLRSEPELSLGLTRVLSAQLKASRTIPVTRRARPVAIVVRATGPGVPLLELADELSWAMCAWGKVAVLYPGEAGEAPGKETRTEAFARFAPLIERCELDHDQVIMVCGSDEHTSTWNEFCMSHADRALAFVAGPLPLERERDGGSSPGWLERLSGSDLVGYGLEPGSGDLAGWIANLEPRSTFSISAGRERRSDVNRVARRLAGRSLGVVLSGGGARAFAHLGVLDVLLDAGMLVDRVGGVSMGAFIGGLLAQGRDSASMDGCCYEEWVRRNPINDYTIPRSSLIKGRKAEAMLERVFGDVRLEELARSFYCASANLRGNRLVVDRDGPMALAVGASICLPLIAPPVRREDGLLIDGSLLDNLPLEPMSSSGEGPVLAIDIKGGEERPRPAEGLSASERSLHPIRQGRLPSLPETMARIALLSSANTDESARRFADLTIGVRVSGVGLLEFHQIDEARSAGRRAALTALEDAPEWLLRGRPSTPDLSGRRTVIRV
ncbi:MAG TPA: MFS transporter [Solirubrobacteraceae bacterium]|nr:MFS transporter [Solirubrobacteraceae bacterium]